MAHEKMRTEQKSNVKNSIGRIGAIVLFLLLQIAWLIVLFIRLNKYSTVIAMITNVITVVCVLTIYGRRINSAMKMPWIMLIMAVPLVGLFLYLLMGTSNSTKKSTKRLAQIDAHVFPKLKQKPEVFRALEQKDMGIAGNVRYLLDYAHYPVYQNTDVVYYKDAAEALEAQKESLEKAGKFIFMEYHAIEDLESFGGIKDILARKAAQGVEVRVFYDDIGSIGFINPQFIKSMKELGIQCRVFNPVTPILNIFMNNRDHRKITVIDGKVGFTGGYNLANEYFHVTEPYGFWKDTGIRLTGDAVRSLTITFLEMWNYMKKTEDEDEDYEKYLPKIEYRAEEEGFVQPYADSPLDGENVGESVYINILNQAKHYCYFVTPYLIITDELNRAFELAAKRGVDVRLITPGIPDKKIIYQMTRSYYNGLVRHGVRVYEYTPGFCHAKMCIADDASAIVGTINLDFRSLYHHFENACYLYECKAVKEIRQDFDEMMEVSNEVTEKYNTGRSTALRLGQCILRLFAPLL